MLPIFDMPGHLIRRAHQMSTAVFASRVGAAGFELTPVQFGALTAIGDDPDLDQATLAERIACDPVTIGGVLNRLQTKGLIQRTVRATDRRARTQRLTDEGVVLLNKVTPIVRALQADIAANLTDDEQKLLVVLLRKFVTASIKNTGDDGNG